MIRTRWAGVALAMAVLAACSGNVDGATLPGRNQSCAVLECNLNAPVALYCNTDEVGPPFRGPAPGGQCKECAGSTFDAVKCASAPPTTTPTTPPPTTTVPSTPTTTTPRPTLPPSPPTTLVPPDLFPARFEPKDVSIAYDTLDDMRWDPRTGQYADQYIRGMTVQTKHAVIAPDVLRAFRAIPSCRGYVGWAASLAENTWKFIAIYLMRDFPESYAWTANYLQGHHIMLAQALSRCATPVDLVMAGFPQLVGLIQRGPVMPHGKKVPARDALYVFNPKEIVPKLTAAQCAALHATHDIHAVHVRELLDHDADIPVAQYRMHVAALSALYGPQVRAAHRRFTEAMGPKYAHLADMVFNGNIDVIEGDPTCTVARADRLTRKTDLDHVQWMDAFGCGTPFAPDPTLIALHLWAHNRRHAARAGCVPGMELPVPSFNEKAEPALAAAYPQCVAGPLMAEPTWKRKQRGAWAYDVHYCPRMPE